MKPNTEIHSKYSQCNKIQKCAANTHNETKNRDLLQIHTMILNTEMCLKYSQMEPNTEMWCKNTKTHSETKYRNVPQILTMKPNTEMHSKYSQ